RSRRGGPRTRTPSAKMPDRRLTGRGGRRHVVGRHRGHVKVVVGHTGMPVQSRPAMTAAIEADRAFCRAMLPRVSRTFAINIRVLAGSMRDAVTVAYLMCR